MVVDEGDVSAVCEASAGGVSVVSCCGGFSIGVPVREVKRGGIIEIDCEVGERIRRRRGLEIVLAFGLDFALAGFVGSEEVIMRESSRDWLSDKGLICGD
jgi:hypothetical protein